METGFSLSVGKQEKDMGSRFREWASRDIIFTILAREKGKLLLVLIGWMGEICNYVSFSASFLWRSIPSITGAPFSLKEIFFICQNPDTNLWADFTQRDLFL